MAISGKIPLYICYRCGRKSESTDAAYRSCGCGVGWHTGKPDPRQVRDLPKSWHVHTYFIRRDSLFLERR